MTLALPVHRSNLAGVTRHALICESDIPLTAILSGAPMALAIITGVEGASYRPLGAVMACDAAGQRIGNLSSGCIERDVALHAVAALADGEPRHLRYGAGSPYLDLTLPCGGGLDILILPRPDLSPLRAAARTLAERRNATLDFGEIRLEIQPELRFLIFGKGPETRALTQLATAAGYQVETYSPDAETLLGLPQGHALPRPHWPNDLSTDPRSAVTLFFHDHDWEPPLLLKALQSDAFYIGAQGSQRAHAARCGALQNLGLPATAIGRLASPFGLIPSVRDPRSLAISVLSDVLAHAAARPSTPRG